MQLRGSPLAFGKNTSTSTKNWFFARITSRDVALSVVKQSAYGFWVVAAIQGDLGIFIAPSMLFDAACYAVLAAVLLRWKSRVAAILLLLLSGTALTVTVLNKIKIGVMQQGGTNIILAVLIAYTAIRAVEATFKIHGRFKETNKAIEPTTTAGAAHLKRSAK
ncbi:MAG: hypothetical protein LBG65_00315 [Puniceicoccales bacterium]|nr:hypothetical protein [Puniceicoccales bacterium]